MSQHFSIIKFNKKIVCHACHLAKQCKLPFPTCHFNTLNCFELVHMAIWGPISIHSLDGFQYFLTIIDDYSRYTWTFLMHTKAETRNHMKKLLLTAKTNSLIALRLFEVIMVLNSLFLSFMLL